jgi:hypothetical protein
MVPEVTDIMTAFRLPTALAAVLTGPKFAANKSLRRLCGATVMNAADAVETSQDATDEGTHEVLKLAGAYFGMYFAAPLIASRMRTDGQVAYESGDQVLVESGETTKTLRYATPKEMQEYRQALWDSAVGILQSIDGLLSIEAENEYVSDQRAWQLERSAPVDNLTYPATESFERVM